MSELNLKDTIAAISTPLGEGGIGIVKISGEDAIKIVDKIFKSRKDNGLDKAKNYTVNYGWIYEKARNKMVDEVLVTVMRAPYSYTREDVAEINCHSGIVPLRKILDLVLSLGARLALPGEFTQRAFINGRIDLAQAEAVLDIVKAKTDEALKVSINQLSGELSKQIGIISESLMQTLAQIEANIDFPEEDVGGLSYRNINKRLRELNKRINNILGSANQGRILREGINVVICGKPNVGKSSLLNMLLRQEKAIVTSIPGTTRDAIEEFVDIQGIPLRFVDTAGIIEPRDLIEREAISRSQKYLNASNLVLLVFDASQKLNAKDKKIIELVKNKEVVAVLNKIDLPQRINTHSLKKRFNKLIRLSATKNIGLKELEREILRRIYAGKATKANGVLISNARHIESLREAQLHIEKSIQSGVKKLSWEFLVFDVKLAIESLNKITGHVISDEILERIFSQFCIGK